MGGDSRRYSRRALLIGAATAGGAGAVAALGGSEGSGNLYGGTMALQEAYQVSENLWIGPDSAKTEVKHANGRIYMATDTQVDYYSNDGAWDKLGVGSSSEPVPSVHTEETQTGTLAYDFTENWPHWPSMPSAAGLTALKPHPQANNPVISAADVDDASPSSVADPFFAYEDGTYYIIAELISGGPSGENIEGAWESRNGLDWTYLGTVLDETDSPDHAYPYVFKWGGEWYLTPTNGDDDFQIYRATDFPLDWELVEVPLTQSDIGLSGQIAEVTVFRWEGRWWLSVNDMASNNDQLLYYTEITDGPPTGRTWTAHDLNPVYTSADKDGDPRVQGRPIVRDDHIDFWMRPDLSLYRVTDLSPSTYEIERVGTHPVMAAMPGTWASNSMHHIDMMPGRHGDNDLVVIDGTDGDVGYRLGIFTTADEMGSYGKLSVTSDSSVADQATDGWQQVSVDEVTYDIPGLAARADLDEFITQRSGYYRFSAQVSFASPTATPFEARLRIRETDNNNVIGWMPAEITANERTISIPRATEYLGYNRNVHLEVWQNSGESQTIDGTPSRTFYEAERKW